MTNRGGKQITLSLEQMADVAAKVDIKEGQGFQDYLDQLTPNTTVNITDMKIFLEAKEPVTLGRFFANVNGVLEASSDGTWKFSGNMTYSDTYDFNSEPFNFNNTSSYNPRGRDFASEVFVRTAAVGIPGTPFPITSVAAPIAQGSANSEAQWLGTGRSGHDMFR